MNYDFHLLDRFSRKSSLPRRRRPIVLPTPETEAKRAAEAKKAADALDAWRERMDRNRNTR